MKPAITTARRKDSKVGSFKIAAATMAVKPAAGPLTLSGDPLMNPIAIPPTTPAMIPENKGTLDPNAMPKHRGSATKNTTKAAGKSA